MTQNNRDEFAWHVEWRDPALLVPYERNAKVHTSEQVKEIANSIKEFGWQQPVVITKDGTLIIGHGRMLAAKELNVKVPCKVIEDDLTDEQIKALRLADNKLNESVWDFDLLALEMLDIDIDMTQFGFEVESEEEKQKAETEKTVKEMQLKAFEHYDYIVFVFKNQFDWLNAVSKFGLEKVDAGYGKTKKIGIGRVLDGARLLEAVEHKDRDSVEKPLGSGADNQNPA